MTDGFEVRRRWRGEGFGAARCLPTHPVMTAPSVGQLHVQPLSPLHIAGAFHSRTKLRFIRSEQIGKQARSGFFVPFGSRPAFNLREEFFGRRQPISLGRSVLFLLHEDKVEAGRITLCQPVQERSCSLGITCQPRQPSVDGNEC